MKYTEEVRDLFTVPSDYYLAHCIAADFALGAGIAVEFVKRFNMKYKLKHFHPNYLFVWSYFNLEGDCLLVENTLNLITKERSYHKPTYNSLITALKIMKQMCESKGITKIAMPLIGCGLDGLEWDKVSKIIQNMFKDADIEILVCRKE